MVCLLGLLSTQTSASKYNTYTTITETIQSKTLDETRVVSVQLPKRYSDKPNKHYPVIYRLDGATNLPIINAVLENLQSQRAAPEVIIVAIENTERLRDLYPTVNRNPAGPVGVGGGGAKFLSFITTELMPLVESKYRTSDFRIIAGASAAGVFSLYALQKHPDLFNAALAYSAAVWWADGATGKSTVEFLKSKTELNHFIYTAIGNEPAPMRPYYDGMIAGIKAHQPKGLRWVNQSFDDVPHNLVSTAAAFSAYHNLFYSEFIQPQDYNGELTSIDNYYAKLSEQHGTDISPPESVIRQLGYSFVNEGNYDEAIKLFKYGISKYPQTPDAYNGLAYGLEQAKQYSEALKEVNKALALASEDHDGYQIYVNRRDRLLKKLHAQ